MPALLGCIARMTEDRSCPLRRRDRWVCVGGVGNEFGLFEQGSNQTSPNRVRMSIGSAGAAVDRHLPAEQAAVGVFPRRGPVDRGGRDITGPQSNPRHRVAASPPRRPLRAVAGPRRRAHRQDCSRGRLARAGSDRHGARTIPGARAGRRGVRPAQHW